MLSSIIRDPRVVESEMATEADNPVPVCETVSHLKVHTLKKLGIFYVNFRNIAHIQSKAVIMLYKEN